MNIEKIVENNLSIAIISGKEEIFTDVQSALDLIFSVQYETGADRIVIDKEMITQDFFVLSTGLAGEILQKFINYNIKVAMYGDYSKYTSKPLKDFIYESNNGKDIFFVETKNDAINNLSKLF
ncbi:MAG: DUF4180 domain-containing protein [Anaerocolumna sp.]